MLVSIGRVAIGVAVGALAYVGAKVVYREAKAVLMEFEEKFQEEQERRRREELRTLAKEMVSAWLTPERRHVG